MTKQEIFDKVTAHLRSQGAAALSSRTGWATYRAEDGKMCAIGCLLEDGEYDPSFECRNVRGLAEDGDLPDRFMDKVEFLEILQSAHDYHLKNNGIPAWETRMAIIADCFGLQRTEATQ